MKIIEPNIRVDSRDGIAFSSSFVANDLDVDWHLVVKYSTSFICRGVLQTQCQSVLLEGGFLTTSFFFVAHTKTLLLAVIGLSVNIYVKLILEKNTKTNCVFFVVERKAGFMRNTLVVSTKFLNARHIEF